MRWAQELGMPLQVNTLVSAETADDIPAIYELLKPLGVARWSLFFLISVGRGKVLAAADARTRRATDGLDLRNVRRRAVYRCHHRSAVVSACALLNRMRERRADGRTDQEEPGVSWIRNPRRKRHRVRIAHRRHLPGRFSAAGGGQCSPGSPGGGLPQLAGVPGAARSGAVSRALRRTANITRYAADRGRARTRLRAIRWARIRSASTSRTHAANLTRNGELLPARWT